MGFDGSRIAFDNDNFFSVNTKSGIDHYFKLWERWNYRYNRSKIRKEKIKRIYE